MSKVTKQKQIEDLTEALQLRNEENNNLRAQLNHIDDFCVGLNFQDADLDGVGPQDAELDLATSDAADEVYRVIKILRDLRKADIATATAAKARNESLSAELASSRGVQKSQAKELERMAIAAQQAAASIERRQAAIVFALDTIGDPDDAQNGDLAPMPNSELRLLRRLLLLSIIG